MLRWPCLLAAPGRRDAKQQLTNSLVRSALILLLAILAGGLTAALTILAGHPPAEAAIAGFGAFGGTLIASTRSSP